MLISSYADITATDIMVLLLWKHSYCVNQDAVWVLLGQSCPLVVAVDPNDDHGVPIYAGNSVLHAPNFYSGNAQKSPACLTGARS